MAPRLSTRKPRQAPPTNVPPREVGPGDNSKAAEEAERVQLISFVNKLTQQDESVQAAKVVFDAAKKQRTQTFNLAKAAGFSRKELEARLAEMGRPTHEIADEEVRVARHRRWLGVLNAEQQEMFTGKATPQDVRDQENWRADGYKAGLLGLIAKPRFECPERFVQAWLLAHSEGATAFREAEAARANPSVREQAAADFAADEPEIDIAAAARKLKNDPKFMERGGPDASEEGPKTDDGFEASEEELAAQKPRLAVVEGRAAEDVV